MVIFYRLAIPWDFLGIDRHSVHAILYTLALNKIIEAPTSLTFVWLLSNLTPCFPALGDSRDMPCFQSMNTYKNASCSTLIHPISVQVFSVSGLSTYYHY